MATMPKPGDYALTVKQPWADLIMAGVKPVENRTWPPPSTLPQWQRCSRCGRRSRDGVPETIPVTKDGRRGTSAHWHDVCLPDIGDVGEMQDDGPFPFRLWIHAAKTEHPEAYIAAAHGPAGDSVPLKLLDDAMEERRRGVLLGSVQMDGCHDADECAEYEPCSSSPTCSDESHVGGPIYCSRWAEPDCYHWQLADPQPLDHPIPMRGRQKLWRITADDLAVTA